MLFIYFVSTKSVLSSGAFVNLSWNCPFMNYFGQFQNYPHLKYKAVAHSAFKNGHKSMVFCRQLRKS
jgi:hypothetical protein